uniref:Carrier domain-containing protein n=1 Tax=Bionectria ochroleuca TaxID=29856 RepID=A0A8H7KDX2_BIOOC
MRLQIPGLSTKQWRSRALITTLPLRKRLSFAAWAIVLARHSNTDDVTFATSISGRQAPVTGLADIPGPAVSTLPVRVRLGASSTISQFLHNIQKQAAETIPYEQFGLQKIGKLSTEIKELCNFTSLLVVQPYQKMAEIGQNVGSLVVPEGLEDQQDEKNLRGYFSMPLVFQVVISDEEFVTNLTYDLNVVSDLQATALMHQVEHVVQELLHNMDRPLSDLSVAGKWDISQAYAMNSDVPDIVDSTFHQMIEKHAVIRPNAVALQAWDATFTYKQYNESANRLAKHLTSRRLISPGDLVHVCFEKSAWHFVSILAINKAGATWIPLDPSHPQQRHRQIITQTGSKLILTSPTHAKSCSEVIDTVVEVSQELDNRLLRDKKISNRNLNISVSSKTACYILFTSGSTGVPKGLVMEHLAVCTSEVATAKRVGLNPEVKMLQFAAFVFDLSIGEIIGALITGATLCIPSETDRINNLERYIQDNKVTWAYFTPAFVRTLKPEDVPSLELLLLAGEAVGKDVFDTWMNKLRLLNAWGPAETCCLTTIHEWKSDLESPLTIGMPVGSHCWIVEPDNPYKLAPTGAIGEVLIQAPTILREYLDNVEKTSASVLRHTPQWAPNTDKPHWGRFFLSGDLCFQNANGHLEFSARKDTQIKIRGLRVEVEEIEHQIRNCLPEVCQVAVDVFNTNSGKQLSAYLCFNKENRIDKKNISWDGMFATMSPELYDKMLELSGRLKAALPSYMVPATFIPCAYMPFITSSKLDRNRLRVETEKLSPLRLSDYSLQNTEKRAPQTDMERDLQTIWASVLKTPVDMIGRDDSFLAIGGDSIAAINLMQEARSQGISITADDVFRHPQLLELALRAHRGDVNSLSSAEAKPLELLTTEESDFISKGIHQLCKLPEDCEIEDAFPCSPLQEGLISLSVKQTGSYITKYFLRISESIDLQRFKAAWEHAVRLNGNLRTRIVSPHGRPIQAIVKNDFAWESTAGMDLVAFTQASQKYEMSFGDPLNRYAIITDKSGKLYFVWVAHHSVIDGWCLQLAFRTLYESYWGETITKLPSYATFIKHTIDQDADAAAAFWEQQLDGATRAIFPISPANNGKPTFAFKRHKIFTNAKYSEGSITKATMLRAAWSLVLARHCNTRDICFGATVSGRSAAVDGLQDMPGPAIATIPVRIKIDQSENVKHFLTAVQNHATDMGSYEQFGLQNIARINASAREACQFSSLMVIRPKEFISGDGSRTILEADQATDITENEMVNYFNYPLILEADIADNHIGIRLAYDVKAMSAELTEAVAHQVDTVMQQLASHHLKSISEISLVDGWDKEHALRHQNLKPSTNLCIHEMIRAQIKKTPKLPAVTSWDGDMTYAELGSYAERLASKLSSLGVGPEVIVGICFSKSIWAVVSMIAINMAGGAFVPLDTAAPVSRLKGILEDTGSSMLLFAPEHKELATSLGVLAHAIDQRTILDLSEPSHRATSSVSPENASFVMFTSGSTGKPKGMIFEHRNTCSTSDSHGAIQGWGPGTRVFSYSMYTFDIGIIDVMVSLSRGACLCIPSEWERYNDIHGAINRMKANWSFFTPTLAGLVNPADIPTIAHVGLGGENVTKQVVDRWRGHATLHNLYGPAEASICGWLADVGIISKPSNIGVPSSSAWWVVEPENPQKFVPIGCVGELLIQGPMMARGYINPDKVSAQAWLRDVDWLPGNMPNKAYLTGDLVRRLEDGTFEYMGRKDTQVKLHGQRVELGEIETRLSMSLTQDMGCVVDTMVNESDMTNTLVALLWYTSGNLSQALDLNIINEVTEEMKVMITDLESSLSEELPPYMVPSVYLIFQGMPERKSSGKIDRRKLCYIAKHTSAKQRLQFSPGGGSREQPASEQEFQLRDLWAQVLRIDANDIGRHDSFLKAGGDSVSAIKLVTIARQSGLSLDVGTVFRDPRLSAMSAAATPMKEESKKDLDPFILMGDDAERALVEAVAKCGLRDASQVDDIFPCTAFQTGLMALTVKEPGSYIAHHSFRLPKQVDVEAFKSAWERTMELCSNMRTRIVQFQGTAVQVIVNGSCTWEELDFNPSSSSKSDGLGKVTMTYGEPLNRYCLHKDQDGITYFLWLSHHTVFDGWTMRVVMDSFHRLYRNEPVPRNGLYNSFIEYTLRASEEANKAFWERQLDGARRASFPPKPTSGAGETHMFNKQLLFAESRKGNITRATVLRAAWALVLARYSDTNDITFAASVSGRNAPVTGIENIPGVMVATVPIRVRMDPEQLVSRFLEEIQNQSTEMMAYEQFGLEKIAKVSADAKEACDFSSLAVVQPVQQLHIAKSDSGELLIPVVNENEGMQSSLQGYFTYPLVMQCALDDNEVDLSLIFDAKTLQTAQIEAIANQFEHVMQGLLENNSQKRLGDLSMVSPWDAETAISRNPVPEVSNDCMHHVVERLAVESPNNQAVDAWDGSLTYCELNNAANKLAHFLVNSYNVKRGDFVHVCMQKSKWYMVAILAVNKAGAAFSPIDPEYPLQRKQKISQTTGAKVLLSCNKFGPACLELMDSVIQIDDGLESRLPNASRGPRVDVSPSDASYILFTSGSTGTPKGFVMEHQALCSSQQAIAKRLALGAPPRILQFANVIFDFSIAEIFQALFNGGCICIPSDHMRMNNIQEFVRNARVDCVCLTPSFASTLSPDQVPGLETIILAGEKVPQDLFTRWFGKVRLINIWGPGETCVASSMHEYTSSEEHTDTIGRPVASCCWIVDPEDPAKLAPIGTVGEVLIQGPTLLREYLGDPVKTKETVLDALPPCALDEQRHQFKRAYRSGDLACYDPSGNLRFVSRKDTQVKIRGLRVELGEIEHHFLSNLEGVKQVAVDVIRSGEATSLVAYFSFSNDKYPASNEKSQTGEMFAHITADLKPRLLKLVGALRLILPTYMVPSTFIPCSFMPVGGSSKLDRRTLLANTQRLSKEALHHYSLVDDEKRPPRARWRFAYKGCGPQY